jgi:hypothetical protein
VPTLPHERNRALDFAVGIGLSLGKANRQFPGEVLMANTSIQKLYQHAQSAREALRRTREKERKASNELVVRAGSGLSTLAGLLIAGTIDGKWGHDGSPDTEKNGIAQIGPVPINAGLGILGIAIGVPGMLPGSEYIVTMGASLLGYPLAKTIEARIQAKQEAK